MKYLLISLITLIFVNESLFAERPSVWITRRTEVGATKDQLSFQFMVHFPNLKSVPEFTIKDIKGKEIFPSEQMMNFKRDEKGTGIRIMTPRPVISGRYILEYTDDGRRVKRPFVLIDDFSKFNKIVVKSDNYLKSGISWETDVVVSKNLDRDQKFLLTAWLTGVDGELKGADESELDTFWEKSSTDPTWKILMPSSEKIAVSNRGLLAFYLRYDLTTSPQSSELAVTESLLFKKVIRDR